jgi:hypothetical protein
MKDASDELNQISKNLDALRKSAEVINNERVKLIAIKNSIESELGQLTARVRGSSSHKTRLSPEEYRQICNRQSVLKKKIAETMVLLAQKNEERKRLNIEIDAADPNRRKIRESIFSSDMQEIGASIKELQSKWMAFAEDSTRVGSMRLMASQFSKDLTEILSKHKGIT